MEEDTGLVPVVDLVAVDLDVVAALGCDDTCCTSGNTRWFVGGILVVARPFGSELVVRGTIVSLWTIVGLVVVASTTMIPASATRNPQPGSKVKVQRVFQAS